MIVVTGATGELGRLVVEQLLEKVPAGRIAVAVRNLEKAADFAARGVEVREADYNRPETLREAFKGADKVLLISGSEVGSRVAQHSAVVDAAKEAGVVLLAYTSAPHADTTPMLLAGEHKATEEYILASGLPYTFLRNGWYNENYLQSAGLGVEHGAIAGSAGEGRVASAARADYAAAAVAVLTGEGHENKIYELFGDVSWSLPELAAEVSAISGKEVVYQDLPVEQYTQVLIGAGLPEQFAAILADVDQAVAAGWLAKKSDDLQALIGRPTTPIADTLLALKQA